MNSRIPFGRIFAYPRATSRVRRDSRRLSLTNLEDRVTPVTNTWSLAGDGLWSVPGNWSQNHIPTSGEDVVIDTNYTVTHDTGSDSVNSLALSNGAKVSLTGGTLTDATTLDVPTASATFAMTGGTLSGATITAGSTITPGNGNGTLNSVTVAGTIDLTTNSNVHAAVTGNLVLSGGTVLLGSNTSQYGLLTFDGTQSLTGTGTVVFGNSYYNFLQAGPSAGSSLTIGPNILIRGHTGGIGYHTGWGGATPVTVVNQGTIQADMGGGTITPNGTNWSNSGTIRAAGGTIAMAGSWTNTGTIASLGTSAAINAVSGATESGNTVTINTVAPHGFAVGQSVTIAGVDQSTYNGTFTITSAATNSFTYTSGYTNQPDGNGGTATLNSTLYLGGTFATPTLGTISSTGGVVALTGTLTNTGSTLNLNASTGPWQLLGGTIDGGTLKTSGAAVLIATTSTGTLAHGVTLDGTFDLTNFNYARATVTGGLTLVSGSTVLIGSNTGLYGLLLFDGGNQTLGGTGTVVFGTSGYNLLQAGPTAATALTIGPGILVHGANGSVGYSGAWGGATDATFTNHGIIQSDTNGGIIALDGNNWTNDGTVQAFNGGNLNLFSNASSGPAWTSSTPLIISGAGSLSLRGNNWTTAGITMNGATVNLGDQFSFADIGTLTRTGGTINITGTLMNSGKTLALDATTGPWRLAGGTIDGGTITTAGANVLLGTSLSGSLTNGVTLAGTLDLSVVSYVRARVTGGLTLAGGTIVIGSLIGDYGLLSFDGGSQTLGGTGDVVFGNNYYNFLQAGPASGSVLTIGPNVLVHGDTGGIGYHPGWGGATDVSFTNLGTIEADGPGIYGIMAMNDTNFAAGTLTGGTWKAVNGTLRIVGADITTNAADIVLDGVNAHLYSTGSTPVDALTSLASNTAAGSITLQNGSAIAAQGQFTNAGNLTVGAGSNFAIRHEFANSVIDYSSQYTTTSWSAAQATGPSNTASYGDFSTSWAPTSINGTQEYLTLGFATPEVSSGAIIRETDGNGFVTKIDAIDTSSVVHTVWTGTDPSEPGTPVDFYATWTQTPYQVAALKIYIDTNHNLGAYEEIDSVQLVGPVTSFNQSGGATNVLSGGLFTLPGGANFTQTGGTTTIDGELTDVSPPTGSALAFDGSNDTVQAPDAPSLDVTNNFTLEAWIKPSGIAGADRPVISKIGGGAGGNNGYQFGVTSDSRLFVLFNALGEPWGSNILKSYPLELQGKWSHIAATFDGNTERLYLNGQLVATLFVGPKAVVDSASPLRIAGDSNNTVFFKGLVDEARVWKTTRTAAELQASADHSLIGDEAGLVGYWPLDEGTGTTAFDRTTNHNDGVMAIGQEPTWAASVHSGAVNVQGDVLGGTGTINLNVVNAATVAPGAGGLAVGGNFTQTSAGAMNVTIGGLASNQYSQLFADGSVSLDGALDVDFANGFLPLIGDTFVTLNKISSGTFGGTTFAGHGEGSFFDTTGPTRFHISYAAGNGNDVNLIAINRPPTLDAIPNPAAILEGDGLQQINLTGIGTGNTDIQGLTVTATSSDPSIIPNPTRTYSSPNATGTLTYTPVPDHYGTVTITVTVTDDGGTANGGINAFSRTFDVTVTPINDAPTLDPIPDPADIYENDPQQTVNLTGISAGVNESQTLTFSATSDNPGLIPNPTFTYTSPNATGSLQYTPVFGQYGIATITVTLMDNGGTANSGVNQIVRTFKVVVLRTPQAPLLPTDTIRMLNPAPKRTKPTVTLPVGTPVSNLIVGATDADSDPIGIAITGIDNAKGVWKFSIDNGATWNDVPTNVAPGAALVLSSDALVGFLPALKFQGFSSFKYRAWDHTDGATNGTQVDSTVPTSTYSTTTERGWIAVGKTKPAVTTAGATALTTVKEDAKASKTFLVKNILGIAALESAPATGLGVAVTGLGSNGKWQYKLAKTKVFVDFDLSVGPSHAFLLRPTDMVRFLPNANANGEGDLMFKTWVPDANFGTFADTTAAGIGVDSGVAAVPIKAVNDAPILDGAASPSLGSVNPGNPPVASTIAALGLAITDVDNATPGIQVLKATGGTWEYSKDGGTTWIKVTKPVYLLATDSIRFTAVATATTGTATLSFKAWDGKAVSKVKDDLTVTIL
ncbi:MAG TPA: LamG-like jellyroll fold domain-containing protein [Gemmataceae bacterium]|jgi:hypothetical protein|nr:LamG-like jellyroll fold domain-containing protein [Gemmataceae bacterium]